MFTKALLVPVVYIDFKLNQEYIAKVLCINRDKPELRCNGHCVLMQKMKKATGSENPEQNQQKERHLLEMICPPDESFAFLNIPAARKISFNYFDHYFFSRFFTIFHPPKTA